MRAKINPNLGPTYVISQVNSVELCNQLISFVTCNFQRVGTLDHNHQLILYAWLCNRTLSFAAAGVAVAGQTKAAVPEAKPVSCCEKKRKSQIDNQNNFCVKFFKGPGLRGGCPGQSKIQFECQLEFEVGEVK